MQREPVLHTARDGVAESRSGQEQRITAESGPMTAFRDVKRTGITLVGVLLLFVAIFAASYTVAHQEHQHPAPRPC